MTKLAPERLAGQMMGVWFMATSLGNLIAGLVGGDIDPAKLDLMPQLFNRTAMSLFAVAALFVGLLCAFCGMVMMGSGMGLGLFTGARSAGMGMGYGGGYGGYY